MSLEDRRGNLVTHRIERCQFTGNRINDSSALSQNWVGAAALFLYGDGAARQTCVRDGPQNATGGWGSQLNALQCTLLWHCQG